MVEKKKTFLDSKRSQSVSISMSKLPSVEKAELSLTCMDETIIERSQISSLLREWIQESELLEYDANNEPGSKWEKPEEYLISLNKIPFAKLKLGVWNFTFEYQENFTLVKIALDSLHNATIEIRENLLIKKFLAYVITIGNILNGGTTKGQADGFAIDFLSKLNGVKDNKNTNLVQYICGLIKKEDENFDGMRKFLPNLESASKLSIEDIKKNIGLIKRDFNVESGNLNKLSSQKDEFVEKAEKIYSNYSTQIEDVEKKLEEYANDLQKTILFFGIDQKDSKYKNPVEFINLMNDFINEVDRSIPKSEPKKVFKGKHEVGKKIENNNMKNILSEMKAKQK
jgi:hypothetical protein